MSSQVSLDSLTGWKLRRNATKDALAAEVLRLRRLVKDLEDKMANCGPPVTQVVQANTIEETYRRLEAAIR